MKLLFVCGENACRSQMAEAFARHHGGGRVEAYSAGSKPRGSVDETATVVMREKGVPLSGHTSKGLSVLPSVEWDALITMGCGDACPTLPAKRRIDWNIPDPARQPIEFYRRVRDTIDAAVTQLLQEFDGANGPPRA